MPFSNPITEIIPKRYSCRTYDPRPIEPETQQLLADLLAANAAGPFGTQPRFGLAAATEKDSDELRGLGTYGFIKGATGFVIGAIKDGEKNLEDFGYLMERAILFATDLGLGTCWLGGSFTRSTFAQRISATDGESVPAVASVGYIADKPRLVDSVMRRWTSAHQRLPWERFFFDGQFGVPLSRQAAGGYAVPLEMVRLGPSASNKQPWRIVRDESAWHLYLQRTPGYRKESNDRARSTADMQRLDMGIAMCHFELTAVELGLTGRWLSHEPDIQKPDHQTEYIASWHTQPGD